MMISNELKQTADNEFEIMKGSPEIPFDTNIDQSELEKKMALEITTAKLLLNSNNISLN